MKPTSANFSFPIGSKCRWIWGQRLDIYHRECEYVWFIISPCLLKVLLAILAFLFWLLLCCLTSLGCHIYLYCTFATLCPIRRRPRFGSTLFSF